MMLAKDEIYPLIESIWVVLLGLPIQRIAAVEICDGHTQCWTGCVHITGEWEGAVTLNCPVSWAGEATSIMLNVTDKAIRKDDIRDALGELTNIIGGNIKALLPGSTQMSLPTVVNGLDYTVSIPNSTVIYQETFMCQGSALRLTVLEGNKN